MRLSIALTLLASVTLAASAQGQVAAGFFPAGEAFRPAESQHVPQVSRALVRTVTPAGGRATVDFPLIGGGRALLWVLTADLGASPAQAAPASLRTPSGRSLRLDESGSAEGTRRRFAVRPSELGLDVRGTHAAFELVAAEPGLHRLEVEATDGSAVTVVAAEPGSPLALATWVSPLSRLPGQPITLVAELRHRGRPVSGARVSVRLAAPGQRAGRVVHLADDGRLGDGTADDGVYSRRLDGLPSDEAGFWTARFEAEGRDPRGVPFARSGTSGFMVERGTALLVGTSVQARHTALGVTLDAVAQVQAAGLYRLDAIVAGEHGGDGERPALAWGELTQRLEAGIVRLSLTVPLPESGDAPGLVEVRLLGLDPMAVAGRTVVPVE